jgi:predicted glycosyltransferase
LLFKVFNKLKNAQHSKFFHKELKKVKQEKESLIVQLSESHALIDSLRSLNTMLFDIIDSHEKKLEKFSSDNLKSMLCIHFNISNKPDLVVDDLSAFTSHVADFELDSISIKLVIVDTACLDNS